MGRETSFRSSIRRHARSFVRVRSLVLTLFAAQFWALAAAATWELLSPFTSNSFEARNLEQFANEVEQATAGGLHMFVLADPARFNSREIKQAVSAGRVPAGEILLSDLRDEDAAFEVDAVPFLASTYDDALRLWDASRPVLEPLLEAQGLHIAFVVALPPRGLFVNKQIWKLEDLQGLRVLDDGPVTRRFAILAGAVPSPRTSGSLAAAFEAGEIDAAIASLPDGAAEQAWRFVPNYYDLRVALPKSVVIFNKGDYRSLDPEIKRAVLNAAIAAQNRGWQASAAANNDTMDLLRTRGMTIAAPEPQVVEGLRGIGATMTDEWARRTGADAQRILQAYQVRSAGGQ
jgi:TRAP-type transport system periplasmic protein